MTAWDGGLALSHRSIIEGRPKGLREEKIGTEKDKNEKDKAEKDRKRKVAQDLEKAKKQRTGAGKDTEKPIPKFDSDAKSKWEDIQKKFDTDPASVVGCLASEISTQERGKYYVRNGKTYDAAKLKAVIGNKCIACAIGTSTNGKMNVVFCNKKGEAGHEHDGNMHVMPEGWAKKFNDRTTSVRIKFQADFVGPK